MARLIVAVISGILLGIFAMLAVARFGSSGDPSPSQIVRDIADVPKMALSAAEKHRSERYVNVSGVEEIVSLPTAFARSEALYTLAGRASSAGIQNLIFEANRIADEMERVDFLEVLFFRLTEIDPHSALALARTDYFKAIKSIEQTVWRTWSRRNLKEALFAAKAQESIDHRNSAAQSLFAAFGYMGNDTTRQIEAELGIGPDRSSRGLFLYQLADRSPADAIAFINGLERGPTQQEYVSWLAYYVSLKNPATAIEYANQFAVMSDSARYSNIINSFIARENPQETIERLLANGKGARSGGEYHYAARALASNDIDAAKQYFEQARSADDRQILGSAIATELAKNDPIEALRWARANEKGRFPSLQLSVLSQIAEANPQLALTEALNTPNTQMRSSLVSIVVQQIARDDPADAVAYLDQIRDRNQKLSASQQLASIWIHKDPDAAIDWILSQDKRTASEIFQRVGSSLVRNDIDAAIRMLPRIDEQSQQNMRQQIAQRLATIHSANEAQSFIRQFEGQPGYDQLQASVISGVAQNDVLMAKQLVDQLADGNARDSAYVQVITQRAQTDPVEAARWLSSVKDERMRGVAAGQLATQWYANDPIAATRWVSNLPDGSLRDDTIMRMSYSWSSLDGGQEDLIASIEDRDKRGRAKVRQVYKLMRTNPVKARKLLDDEDIPSDQRQQAETMISQYGSRF